MYTAPARAHLRNLALSPGAMKRMKLLETVLTCDLGDTLSSEDFLAAVENDPWIAMIYKNQ